ncbi:MAG: hypothetical protein ACOCUD_04085, partial [Bacillota bacterium]
MDSDLGLVKCNYCGGKIKVENAIITDEGHYHQGCYQDMLELGIDYDDFNSIEIQGHSTGSDDYFYDDDEGLTGTIKWDYDW